MLQVEVAVTCLKNSIVGSLKQKELVVEQEYKPYLNNLLYIQRLHAQIFLRFCSNFYNRKYSLSLVDIGISADQ